MADMASVTGTGHSPRQERHIANILYVIIGVAVVLGLVVALIISQGRGMSPFQSAVPTKSAPDTHPGDRL